MGTFNKIVKNYGVSGLLAFIKIKTGTTNSITLRGVLHPIRLRSNTSDITTFKHIFAHDDYEFEVEVEPQIIIDAGANVGLASIFFANKYPKAKIYSIELAPSNYKILVENTCNYKSVKVFNAGLWHKKEILRFQEKGISPWGFKVENDLDNYSISVPSITLNELIIKYDIKFIDILKVDIEGAEVEVFSENYESWLPKVKYLVIETHDRWRENSTNVVKEALSKFDFLELGKVGENLLFKNNR